MDALLFIERWFNFDILEEPLFGNFSHPRIDWKWIFNGVLNDESGHSTFLAHNLKALLLAF